MAVQRAPGDFAGLAYHLVLPHHPHGLQGPGAGQGKTERGFWVLFPTIVVLLRNHEKLGFSVRAGVGS